MASQSLRCSCGHSWERPVPGPVPADIRQICPACTPSIQAASNPTNPSAEPVRSDLKPGDRFAGFEIVKPLNRGGMGVVYKAKQIGLNRCVALKVVAPERLQGKDQAEYLERFRREARAAALLNHPNVVTVYATDLVGSQPYFAMEFVDGIDLYHLVRKSGPLAFLESCDYIRQAALGLQHAYECGLVHRDIKPHNLMVTPSPLESNADRGARRTPTVKILDMGLARLDAAEDGLTEGLTCAEAFLGTPDYAAPEQAEDSRSVDIRADLYSLGATWFFLLTGQVPFPGTSLMQKLRRQLTGPTPLVSEYRSDVPPILDALIRKLMDREPSQRVQTPGELADAIAEYVRNPSKLPDWMADPQEVPLTVSAHPPGVTSICINGDGSLLLTGGDDQALRLWAVPELTEVRKLTGDPGLVSGVAITGSGKWGASCALRMLRQEMVVQLWDLGTGVQLKRLRGAEDNLTCVVLTANGRKVAAGTRDGTVHLWTLDPPGTPPLTMSGHKEAVTALFFAADGMAVYSGGQDGTVRMWDIESRTGEILIHGGAGSVRAISGDKNGNYLAVAGAKLILCDADGLIRSLAGHDGPVLCVALAFDGTVLVSGGWDGTVRLWRTSNGQELAQFAGHEGPVRSLVFSSDQRFVYSGGADGTLRRWPARAAAAARN
ncbi:MAG TPA: serine/threonine-protein kinase [Gemmataceae bacterium]|jgi:serine/threonine protein kinase|nr:serine/threonine-protein kinase [Gemmataceae bacterium]